MVLGRRGQAPAEVENSLHQHPELEGHWLYAPPFLSLPRVRPLNFAPGRAGLQELRAALEEPAWVVVNVFGPRWVARLPEGCTSAHGELCAPGDSSRPWHSVVLVGWEEDVFFVLDPYFSSSQQPFEATDDELLACLMGFAIVVPK